MESVKKGGLEYAVSAYLCKWKRNIIRTNYDLPKEKA